MSFKLKSEPFLDLEKFEEINKKHISAFLDSSYYNLYKLQNNFQQLQIALNYLNHDHNVNFIPNITETLRLLASKLYSDIILNIEKLHENNNIIKTLCSYTESIIQKCAKSIISAAPLEIYFNTYQNFNILQYLENYASSLNLSFEFRNSMIKTFVIDLDLDLQHIFQIFYQRWLDVNILKEDFDSIYL
ncbi:unnamed protein product [Gordionus sp. m RMFG-2023]